MSDIVNEPITCKCGYVFHDDGLDKETGKKIPCPNCGSVIRNQTRKADVSIGLKAGVGGILKTYMTPESWTILGLILGLVTPPIFYIVFTFIDTCIGYKLLIWLGVILIIFFLTRSFMFIHFLRWIADKTYGKKEI